MNFTFSDEQEELRRTARRFLEDKSPSSEVRRLMATAEGYDEAVWKQMAQELGLQALAIPDEYGGQGFTYVELGIVFEEMGRVLLCAPFYSTCVAAAAILNAASPDQRAAWLPGIASGQTIATLALAEPGGSWDAAGVHAEAVPDGEGARITGTKTLVLDGTIASLIIVAARTPDGEVGLYAVEGDADGLTRTAQEPLDMTRKLAKVGFDGVHATRLGDATWDAVSRTLDHAAVLLSAEMAGGAARCLDMAVEYAKSRYQFGKPIGAFQAIKHKCADILLQVESARTAAYYAMWAAAQDDPDLPVAAPMAKAFCADAYFFAASENHQVHGGIGFTWEHDAHLYFRRAKSSDLLFGDSNAQRDLLAGRLGF